MNETEKDIKEIIDSCNGNNIPFNSLCYGDFISDNIKHLWEKLESDDKIDTFKLWEIVSKNIQIDRTKICKYYLWDIAVEEKDNLLFEKYPEIEKLLDEHGMMEIPYPSDLNKNSFKYKNDYLIIDNSFASNFHFTEWIIRNWDGSFKLRLPINKDSIGISSTRRNSMLLSHWQGPKTIENIRNMSNKERYIVKGPNNFSASILDKTQFYFFFQDKKWQLEIEELIPFEGLGYSESKTILNKTHKFYTKYLHAFVSPDLTSCYHIDGGIRVYSSLEEFKRRNSMELNSDKAELKKISDRYKIFRIDSSNGINSYQEIIGLFFNFNPYISEFFEGESSFSKDIESRRSKMLEYDLNKKSL